jgi:hypothetical protein
MEIHNPQITGNNVVTGSLIVSGSVTTIGNQTINGNLSVNGNLTAQQYIVSSSVTFLTTSFSSGSTKFGDSIDDTHQFTGSLSISGSQVINGTLGVSIGGATELNVQQAGVTLGNVVTDTHRVTGSLNVSGSVAITTNNSPGLDIRKDASADNRYLRLTNTQASSKTWDLINQTNANSNSFTIYNVTDNLSVLGISPTGAGTFASSVQATNLFVGTTGTATTLNSIQSPYGILSGLIEANIAGNAYYNSGWKYYGNGPTGVFNIDTSGNFGFYTAASGTSNNNISLGNAKVTITNGGSLGVGTTSPATNLHVLIPNVANNRAEIFRLTDGVTTDFKILLARGTTADNSVSVVNTYSGIMSFETNNIERMRIALGGNVGIGTTSPSKLLSVYSSANTNTAQAVIFDAGSTSKLYLGTFSNNAYLSYGGTYSSGWSADGTNSIAVINMTGANNDSTISFATSQTNGAGPTERMRITSSGNVGIGTTSPFSTNGTNLEIASSTSSASRLILTNSSASGRQYFFQNQGDGNLIIYDNTAASERMRITAAGRIIVNNSVANDSGDRNLTIQGSVGASNNDVASINLTQVWNGTSYPVILAAQQDLTYGNASGAFVLKTSYWNGSAVITAERVRVNSIGNMGIGVTSPQDRLDVNGSIRFRANTPNFTAVLDNGVLDYVPTSVFATDPVIRMAAIGTSTIGANIAFHTGTSTSVSERVRITSTGVVQPGANGTQDLGTASLRWGTIYTSDLSLSNGIGDYTIVEGEEKLYLYNNKNNKVYSFVLHEEDPLTATPKKS